jgi:hypothetical protein
MYTENLLYVFMLAGHRVGRMLCFFSSCRNWDPPNPSPAGGRGTLAGEKGVGRVPIPTSEGTYSVVLTLTQARQQDTHHTDTPVEGVGGGGGWSN